MDDAGIPDVESSAARAFGDLRAEISLLRRAVEWLTDERTAQPDYAPSLEAIAKRLEDVCVWARRVSEQPAMKLTPEGIGRQIAESGTSCRERDEQLLQRAAAGMDATVSRIDGMIARSRTVAEQQRVLLHKRIAFAVAGMALFAILPGAIARSLPISWAVPERIAARMLRTDMWNAGQQMMRKADSKRWNEQVNHRRGEPRQMRE